MKIRAAFALCGLFVATTLIACGPPPAKNTAKKVGKEAGVSDNSPSSLADTKFDESPTGKPEEIGCADGQREGFANLEKFPTIAGCLGAWEGKMSLRKGPTGKACGDDGETCSSPADVCAPGWHVCARKGDYQDVSDRIDDKQCVDGAGPGKFIAGISHVKKKKECSAPPKPTTRYPCFKEGYGAEPVCCGQGCRTGECRDAVWPAKTRISVGKAEGCGNVSSARNGGVMCCKDSEDAPARVLPVRELPTAEGAPTATTVAPPEGADAAGAPVEAAAGAEDAKAEDAKADEKKVDDKKAEDAKVDEKKEG